MKINRGFVPLTKDEICRLDGGHRRGEELLFAVELGPLVRAWVYGHLRNQYRTQRCPKHPEGWEPITADGFGNELRYDLATGTLELPTPAVWNDGTLCVFPQRHPANIYRHHAGNETAQLKRRDARIWTARFHLVRALRQHWNDARQIGMLMTETLGIPWQEKTSEPRAARLIAYAYEIHEQTCRDLTDLLKVAPQVLQRAA